MKALVTSLFCGFLFGLGLIVSGMSNPARVLNFLDWSANWDATLAFVMGGAIAIAAPGIYWARKQGSPLFADKFDIPTSTKIDSKLIPNRLKIDLKAIILFLQTPAACD